MTSMNLTMLGLWTDCMIFIYWKRAPFKYSSESTEIIQKLTCILLNHLYCHLLVSCVRYSCVDTTICTSTQTRVHSNLVTVNLLYTHLLNLDNYISYYYQIPNLNIKPSETKFIFLKHTFYSIQTQWLFYKLKDIDTDSFKINIEGKTNR